MGFTKRKGVATVAILIIAAVFNVAAFLLPVPHSVTFWLGYSFAMLSAVLMLAVILFLFHAEDSTKTFLRLPLAKIAWAYFVLQIAASIWQIANFVTPYLLPLIIDCCLTGFFLIAVLVSHVTAESIEKQDERTAQKVLFLKNIQAMLSTIKTNDMTLSRKIERLSEDFQFSDPMSHSMLGELERQIESKVVLLKSEISDETKAAASIDGISDLLKERNQKCKMLKNVKEETPPKDNSGVKYVAIAVSVIGIMATIALVVTFVVIPNGKYKAAMQLYENEQYEEAILAFEEISGFSNSNQMIEATEEALLDKQYLLAQKLFENEQYEKAIEILENLGGFKNSKELIETIKQKITEDQYALAESNFENQNYVDAIKLYTELGDYKDSKQKIEQIYNRLSEEDVLYYGSYRNEPIAWRVIREEDNRLFLITQKPICELPYNDEIKNVEWNNSSLCKWLNGDFIRAFSDSQLAAVVTVQVDGSENKAFLLSQQEVEEIEDNSLLQSEKDWWVRSKNESNAMFVEPSGEVNEEGESVVRAKGVRPCMWIDLS